MERPGKLSRGARQEMINHFLVVFFIKNIALKWVYKGIGELIFLVP